MPNIEVASSKDLEELDSGRRGSNDYQKQCVQARESFVNFIQQHCDQRPIEEIVAGCHRTSEEDRLALEHIRQQGFQVANGRELLQLYWKRWFFSLRVPEVEVDKTTGKKRKTGNQVAPKLGYASNLKAKISVQFKKHYQIDLVCPILFPNHGDWWKNYCHHLKSQGRGHITHREELDHDFTESVYELGLHCLLALKHRGTEQGEDLKNKLSEDVQLIAHKIIQYVAIYIVILHQVRRGQEGLEMLRVNQMTPAVHKIWGTKAWKKVSSEVEKNHQADLEELEKTGEVPYLDLYDTEYGPFNPGQFLEDFRQFMPSTDDLQHCGRFFLTPKNVSGKFNLWDPAHQIFYEKQKPLGHNSIQVVPKLCALTGLDYKGNHSARKTAICAMKNANYENKDVVKFSGHKHEVSIGKFYDTGVNDLQKMDVAVALNQNGALRRGEPVIKVSTEMIKKFKESNPVNNFHSAADMLKRNMDSQSSTGSSLKPAFPPRSQLNLPSTATSNGPHQTSSKPAFPPRSTLNLPSTASSKRPQTSSSQPAFPPCSTLNLPSTATSNRPSQTSSSQPTFLPPSMLNPPSTASSNSPQFKSPAAFISEPSNTVSITSAPPSPMSPGGLSGKSSKTSKATTGYLSDYEQIKMQNIKEKEAFLKKLNIQEEKSFLNNAAKKKISIRTKPLPKIVEKSSRELRLKPKISYKEAQNDDDNLEMKNEKDTSNFALIDASPVKFKTNEEKVEDLFDASQLKFKTNEDKVEEKNKLGTIVWAKIRGHHIWPGILANPTDFNMENKKKPFVRFCGTPPQFGYVEDYNIKNYLEFRERFTKNKKDGRFLEAVRLADIASSERNIHFEAVSLKNKEKSPDEVDEVTSSGEVEVDEETYPDEIDKETSPNNDKETNPDEIDKETSPNNDKETSPDEVDKETVDVNEEPREIKVDKGTKVVVGENAKEIEANEQIGPHEVVEETSEIEVLEDFPNAHEEMLIDQVDDDDERNDESNVIIIDTNSPVNDDVEMASVSKNDLRSAEENEHSTINIQSRVEKENVIKPNFTREQIVSQTREKDRSNINVNPMRVEKENVIDPNYAREQIVLKEHENNSNGKRELMRNKKPWTKASTSYPLKNISANVAVPTRMEKHLSSGQNTPSQLVPNQINQSQLVPNKINQSQLVPNQIDQSQLVQNQINQSQHVRNQINQNQHVRNQINQNQHVQFNQLKAFQEYKSFQQYQEFKLFRQFQQMQEFQNMQQLQQLQQVSENNRTRTHENTFLQTTLISSQSQSFASSSRDLNSVQGNLGPGSDRKP